MPSRKGKEIISNELAVESTDESVVPKISRIPSNKEIVRDSASTSESYSKAAKWELEVMHPRFGPLYPVKQEAVDCLKQKAWEHVLSKSPDSPSDTTEIYLKAMREVELKAMEMYAGIPCPEGLDEFRWMMIMDGCFFIQLALVIVGCGERLGYLETELIFGREQKKENMRKWIVAMFYVGNQIPLLVLRVLMEQTFFKGVIATARLDRPPSGLCEQVLYDVLILPSLGRNLQRRTLVERVMGRGPRGKDVEKQPQQPNHYHDLLHGFRSLLIGPSTQEDEDDEDVNDHADGRIFLSATELKKKCIHLQQLKSGAGVRGILFQRRYFWANVYLPALAVDENTELALGNLKIYDNIHRSGQRGREVCSYLRLMGDLIQTKRDAILLHNKGIIQGQLANVKRLPAMFNRLASEDTALTQELRRLRSEISDYTSPWVQYKGVLSLVVVLSFIQTLFTVLGYFKPLKHD